MYLLLGCLSGEAKLASGCGETCMHAPMWYPKANDSTATTTFVGIANLGRCMPARGHARLSAAATAIAAFVF